MCNYCATQFEFIAVLAVKWVIIYPCCERGIWYKAY